MLSSRLSARLMTVVQRLVEEEKREGKCRKEYGGMYRSTVATTTRQVFEMYEVFKT